MFRSVVGRSDRMNAVLGRFSREQFQCDDRRFSGLAASLAERSSGRCEEHARDCDDHHSSDLVNCQGPFSKDAHIWETTIFGGCSRYDTAHVERKVMPAGHRRA